MSKVFFMCGTIVDFTFDDGLAIVEQGNGRYASRKRDPAMVVLLQAVLGHDEVGILAYPTYDQWLSSNPDVPHTVQERMRPHNPFTGEMM